jgi:hypothetical protein
VIAAGSTGSIPATAALLAAITDLERGVLVLPGVDTSLGPDQHKRLLEGETTQSHPQYGLMKLLRRLGAGDRRGDRPGGRTSAHRPAARTRWRQRMRRPAGVAGAPRSTSSRRWPGSASSRPALPISRRARWRSRRARRWPKGAPSAS